MAETANFGLWHVLVAQSGREETINENFSIVDAILSGSVVSSTILAPPAAPTDGQMWAVPAAATGTWATQDGKLAIFIGGGWVFKVPKSGVSFVDLASGMDVSSDGSAWISAAYIGEAPQDGGAYVRQDSAWVEFTPAGGMYDIECDFVGTPISSEVITFKTVARRVDVPANFDLSVGHVGVNPTASFAIDVQDDGVSIGTITISALGVFTFATTGGGALVIDAGSRITFVAPATVDATIADISVELFATTDGSGISAVVPFHPSSFFASGELGTVYDLSDLTTLWQDVAKTVPVTANNDPIAVMEDVSGNGQHWIETDPALRPLYQTDGTRHWMVLSGATGIETTMAWLVGTGESNHFVAGAMTGSVSDNAAFMATSFTGITPGVSRVIGFTNAATLKIDVLYYNAQALITAAANNVCEGLFKTTTVRAAVNGSVITDNVGATGMNTVSGQTRLGEGVTGIKAPQTQYCGLIINRELTPTENADLVAWMASKFS